MIKQVFCAKHFGGADVEPSRMRVFAPEMLAPGSVVGSGRNFD